MITAIGMLAATALIALACAPLIKRALTFPEGEPMGHECKLPNCDGTRLGHELARDFPAELAGIAEEFARLAEPADGLRVNPENLRVGESDSDERSD